MAISASDPNNPSREQWLHGPQHDELLCSELNEFVQLFDTNTMSVVDYDPYHAFHYRVQDQIPRGWENRQVQIPSLMTHIPRVQIMKLGRLMKQSHVS